MPEVSKERSRASHVRRLVLAEYGENRLHVDAEGEGRGPAGGRRDVIVSGDGG